MSISATKTVFGSVIAAFGLLLTSAAVQAQSPDFSKAPSLMEWQYESLYEETGLRADHLLAERAFGAEGRKIGTVEDVIIDQHGQAVALILEVGEFWPAGVTSIVVPWKQVKLVPDGVKVPVTGENYEQYLLFGDGSFITLDSVQPVNATLAMAAETWKLTRLLGDYVFVDRSAGYGYVSDVILTKAGKVRAIVVNASVKGSDPGRYAYPFNDYIFGEQPFDDIYILPYGSDEIESLEPFHYGQFDGYWD